MCSPARAGDGGDAGPNARQPMSGLGCHPSPLGGLAKRRGVGHQAIAGDGTSFRAHEAMGSREQAEARGVVGADHKQESAFPESTDIDLIAARAKRCQRRG